MISSSVRQSCLYRKPKGSLVINQTFLLVLALVVLVILIGFTLFLGGNAEEMLKSLGSLVPKTE